MNMSGKDVAPRVTTRSLGGGARSESCARWPLDPQKVKTIRASQHHRTATIVCAWRCDRCTFIYLFYAEGMCTPFLSIDCRSYDARTLAEKVRIPTLGLSRKRTARTGRMLAPRMPTVAQKRPERGHRCTLCDRGVRREFAQSIDSVKRRRAHDQVL